MLYNYKVNYRLDFHPLAAPSGFYSYICKATSAREAKRLVKKNVGGKLREKGTSVKFGAMSAHRID